MATTFALPFVNQINQKEKNFLLRQLAIMVSSGIPLSTALTLASQQTSSPILRASLRAITKDIEHGQAFSSAAARFPAVFDDISIAMIKSGESSGQLQMVLEELATRSEQSIEFNNKVRNALLYPIFVVAVMIVVGIIMTTVIVPRLAGLFEETNLTLPWTTRVLVFVSTSIIHYWYLILLLLIGIALLIRSYVALPAGREQLYRLQRRIPIFSALIANSYLVRFTLLLSMLIKSGVPITDALRTVGDSMTHQAWKRALRVSQQEVERGIPLSTALARHPDIFPPSLTQMMAVGEQTGKLDTVLGTMNSFYQSQTEATIKAITSLIEPVILLIVALGVGFVVVSVILPIYGLAEQI